MKKWIFSFFIIFLHFVLIAQEDEAKLIAISFQKGDVQAISAYFSSSLDMTVVENENVYSKAQATQILSQFFKSNKPSTFSVKHKGASKGGDYYQIGTLTTNNGEYRVTFFLKKDEEVVYIKRLKIEANEGNF
jgi:hypothetical protein